MAVHIIKAVQHIPITLTDAWEFFSNPANLQKITPGSMGFIIISEFTNDKIFPGQVIEYKVSPVLGIPLYWMTEITHVKDKEFFVDEQRKGPYRMWRHQHYFKQVPGGIEMTDIVHYKTPLGLLGNLANNLIIKKKLKNIFEFRFRKIEELFGEWEGQKPFIGIS